MVRQQPAAADATVTTTTNAAEEVGKAGEATPLAGVLQQAVDATATDAPRISEQELQALQQVAHDHRDVDDVRTVSIELVAVMLRTNYGRMRFSEATFAAMAARLAETLCEAPSTAPRMQRLWDQLRSAAP